MTKNINDGDSTS